MIKPIRKNVLLKIQDSDESYTPLIVKPNSYREMSGKMILVAKANNSDCEVPIGSEVLLDYDTETIKENILHINGECYFMVRETFIMAWLDESVISLEASPAHL